MIVLLALGLAFAGALAWGMSHAPWQRSLRDTAWGERDALVSPAPSHDFASPTRAALSLARVEAKAWLATPWFAAGIAFCLLEVLLFGTSWSADVGSWPAFVVLLPILAHPMTGMAVVGAHFAATRSGRDRSEEIFAACPADEATRTAAHALSGWVPSAALAAFSAVVMSAAALRASEHYGYSPRSIGDVLAAVILGWCGATLGVALARWAPFVLAPIVFVVALSPLIIGLGNLGAPHWSNLRQLSTWPRYPDHDLLFTDRHVWSHAAWLAALGALMVAVALLHARRGKRMWLGAGAVALSAALIGAVMVRPISDAAANRIASLVTDPAAHQACRPVDDVSVCVFRGYEKYAKQVAGEIAPIASTLRTLGATAPLELRQHFDGRVATLGPEVARAMRGRAVGRPGAPLGYDTSRLSMRRARLVIAAAATGLPTSPTRRIPYVAAGQARGVVMLWLAARGLPRREQLDLATFHLEWQGPRDGDTPGEWELGNAWPQTCDGAPPSVVWSETDLLAARLLLSQPAHEVRAALAANWARVLDPATTTNQFLATLRVGPVPPPPPITPLPFRC